MIETKILELRDKGTFIPILCTQIGGEISTSGQENWLLRRAGFGSNLIQLTSFIKGQSKYDYYEWGDRTYQVAHKYIEENWDDIKPGDVIDVEFILGDTDEPKTTERE